MYQYQFLPPPISSHYGLAKMRYIKRTLIASLLITRLRGLLTLLKVLNISVHFFKSRFLCQEKLEPGSGFPCLVVNIIITIIILTTIIIIIIVSQDILVWRCPPPPQLPTPPSHSVSTQLFPSYLIIWRAHSILSAWWRFSFCLHFSPSTLTMQLDSF